MNKTVDFLKEARVFFISTINEDKPEVRPFGAINVFNGKLYLTTSNTKDVYKQMVKNNNIAISAMNANGEWIRISAKAIVDNDRAARVSMLDNNPNLRSMYNEDDGKFEVFYLKDAKTTISSFSKAPVVEEF